MSQQVIKIDRANEPISIVIIKLERELYVGIRVTLEHQHVDMHVSREVHRFYFWHVRRLLEHPVVPDSYFFKVYAKDVAEVCDAALLIHVEGERIVVCVLGDLRQEVEGFENVQEVFEAEMLPV